MDIKGKLQGSCHCGAVTFEVMLPNGFERLTRCNCSMCARRGAVVAPVAMDNFKLMQGADVLTLYQFNTRTAEHYFCAVCGIYTHHRRRSNPNLYSINIACLAGIDPFSFDKVEVTDGINHSCDRNK